MDKFVFFILMTSDFATSYNELSLHRLRTLFSMETSITSILTLNATYNETYVIQTLISIDTLTVWTVLRFHQCSQESELVGEGLALSTFSAYLNITITISYPPFFHMLAKILISSTPLIFVGISFKDR